MLARAKVMGNPAFATLTMTSRGNRRIIFGYLTASNFCGMHFKGMHNTMPDWIGHEDDCTKLELVAISAVTERMTKKFCLICNKLSPDILELVCLNMLARVNLDLVLAFFGRLHDAILTYLVKRWWPAFATIQRILYSMPSKSSCKCYEAPENRIL